MQSVGRILGRLRIGCRKALYVVSIPPNLPKVLGWLWALMKSSCKSLSSITQADVSLLVQVTGRILTLRLCLKYMHTLGQEVSRWLFGWVTISLKPDCSSGSFCVG